MLRRIPSLDPKTGEEILEPLLFELGRPGRTGGYVPETSAALDEKALPAGARRKTPLGLPELSEVEVIRHFTHLSTMNHNLDRDLYPLGSCTMKHNPRVNEEIAALPGFAKIHPWQPDDTVQGALAVLFHLERILAALTGMDAFTLQPPAGAAGEFTGIAAILAYHHARGEDKFAQRIHDHVRLVVLDVMPALLGDHLAGVGKAAHHLLLQFGPHGNKLSRAGGMRG